MELSALEPCGLSTGVAILVVILAKDTPDDYMFGVLGMLYGGGSVGWDCGGIGPRTLSMPLISPPCNKVLVFGQWLVCLIR